MVFRVRSGIVLSLAFVIGVPLLLTATQAQWCELSRKEHVDTLTGLEANEYVENKRTRDYYFDAKCRLNTVEWAVVAAADAAGPCIGSGIGWVACVGSAAAGSYAGRAVYLMAEFGATGWTGGGECDEKPQCDLYPNHPCCQI